MKKYYMTIPQQPKDKLRLFNYGNPGNSAVLEYNRETRFPLIPLISNTAEKGEKIGIYLIKPAYDTTDIWLGEFIKELDALSTEKGFEYDTPTIIDCSASEVIDNHLELFGRLIETVVDGDSIYCDVSYGTKPIPMIMLMFTNFAYRFRENVMIEKLVYGAVAHNTIPAQSNLFDVTALFYMNATVNTIPQTQDPVSLIKELIKM